MKKKLFILSALCLCAINLMAQDTALTANTVAPQEPQTLQQIVIKPQHFGYFSYNEALKSMPEYEIAQSTLADLRAKYEAEMKRSEEDFVKRFNEFISGQKSFPENIMLKRQKELQQLMEQSMAFKTEAQQMLLQAEKDLMQPLHKRLTEILQKVGLDNNYAFILNTDSNAYPFINTTGEAEDITEVVTSLLKQ